MVAILTKPTKHPKGITNYMLSDNNKIWTQYKEGISAADADSAQFLIRYMHHILIHRPHIESIEIIDLQRYKKHTTRRKVIQALNEELSTPFVFLIHKN